MHETSLNSYAISIIPCLLLSQGEYPRHPPLICLITSVTEPVTGPTQSCSGMGKTWHHVLVHS